MRLRLFIALGFVIALAPKSFAAIDFQCESDCLDKGYMLQYCEQLCSYGDQQQQQPQQPESPGPVPTPMPSMPHIDYKCELDCLNKGYMLKYCEEVCSY